MLRQAFRSVECVVFLVGPHNHGPRRAVGKIGGVRAGSRPDASGLEGVVYENTAAAFGQGGPDCGSDPA